MFSRDGNFKNRQYVENNYVNVVSTAQVPKEKLSDEFEFYCSDNVNSVIIYSYKKKLVTDQVLADIEIPIICFDPDENWHEVVFSLKDRTYSDQGGFQCHQFVAARIEPPTPCYHCGAVMLSDDSLPELEFYRCEECNVECHEKCHSAIISSCSKVTSVTISYFYVKENILVILFS